MSGTTLTNNEIKDIINVVKCLENRGILLRGITRKITRHEGGFLNFLRQLMAGGLPLLKNVLTLLARSVLLLFGLPATMSATGAAIQRKIHRSGITELINSNWRHNENS